jgi:hypothetical protein
MKAIPLTAPISMIPFSEYQWFVGKEPLIAVCENKAEAKHRLTWLSEGSLHYHLKGKPVQHGGDPAEVELYKSFRLYLSRLSVV